MATVQYVYSVHMQYVITAAGYCTIVDGLNNELPFTVFAYCVLCSLS